MDFLGEVGFKNIKDIFSKIDVKKVKTTVQITLGSLTEDKPRKSNFLQKLTHGLDIYSCSILTGHMRLKYLYKLFLYTEIFLSLLLTIWAEGQLYVTQNWSTFENIETIWLINEKLSIRIRQKSATFQRKSALLSSESALLQTKPALK